MKPLDFPLLADENIHPEVIGALIAAGREVRSVHSEGLSGKEDREILHHAHSRDWVILTHDSDFGALTIRRGEPYTGIIYLRPGHIAPEFVLQVLEAVRAIPIETPTPFLVGAERKEERVRVRIRSASGL
jgi:predicted nuclease of predicted toxin-antitoxin system